MEAGNINQCSFGFYFNWDNKDCDSWEYDKESDIYKRVILDIKTLCDVSPVTFPAYKSTECVLAKRRLEDLKQDLQKQKDTELLKRKLELELELQ
jgi:phage head maturation protease